MDGGQKDADPSVLEQVHRVRKCPLWVTSASCPLFPSQRTFVIALSMSALCHKRTFHRGHVGGRIARYGYASRFLFQSQAQISTHQEPYPNGLEMPQA